MRHIGRPPNSVRVVVLVFAAMVLTLGLHTGSSVENAGNEPFSFAQSFLAEGDPVAPVIADAADSNEQTVHCPYHCVRAPVVRPRAGYLWYAALVIAGLLLGGAGHRVWRPRPGVFRRPATEVAGAELLLRLCVSRR